MAMCAALLVTAGTEAASGASKLHFAKGRGNMVASRIVSCASRVNIARDCCPLMITKEVPTTLRVDQRSRGLAYAGLRHANAMFPKSHPLYKRWAGY